MSFDHHNIAAAVSRPGIDPRMWISYATVDEDTPNARSVRYLDDEGNPLPSGPLVTITCQPSGITTVARVASFVAGIGEGTWYPFQEKDELLVAFAEGNESSAIILGRLNQAIDTFPTKVAGQDATKNNFGFWRLKAPFIIESAEAFLIRSAKTGSQIGIDGTGQVILNNGDKNNVIIGSDAISFSSGDDKTFLQLNFSENRITAATGNARLELSASGESILQAPSALNIGTSGVRGNGHAVTVEQLVAWTANLISVLASPAVLGFNPLSPVLGAPAWSLTAASPAAALNLIFTALIPGCVAPNPVGAMPGGLMAPIAPAFQLLKAGMANPLPLTDPTGLIPGLGRAGLML